MVSSSSAVTFISPYFSRVCRADDPHQPPDTERIGASCGGIPLARAPGCRSWSQGNALFEPPCDMPTGQTIDADPPERHTPTTSRSPSLVTYFAPVIVFELRTTPGLSRWGFVSCILL